MTTDLEQVAQFVADLQWRDLPSATQHRALLTFRDTVGVLIGGAETPAAQAAKAATHRNRGNRSLEAFALAVQASALDFDDGHYLGGAIHPGSAIVSALLVAAQEVLVGMPELLAAQVAGYEVALRAAHLLWPQHDLDTYHCTGTAVTLGVAAAVAKLRGYSEDAIRRSMSIAWAHAPMATFQLPMVKEGIGWAATTGHFAADLASVGFMAGSNGPSAIAVTFPPTPFDWPAASYNPFVQSLGTVFEATNTYFKPYAACRYTHTAAKSLQELVSEHHVTPGQIECIDVFTHRGAMNLTDTTPTTLDHAQYSFPFVLASIACTGRAGAREIHTDCLHDIDRLAMAQRVRVHHDPDFDVHYPAHYGARIVVTTTFGTHERTRLVAPGDDADPMSAQELQRKFVDLARPCFREETDQVATELTDADTDPTNLRERMNQVVGYCWQDD
jgi:2-methylcitrate dehydratase PrpD